MNHANRTNAERFSTSRDANVLFKLSTWAWKLFSCRFPYTFLRCEIRCTFCRSIYVT